jgi:flagellar hook-length control protein fliK
MAGTTIKGVGNDGNVQIRDMVTAAKQNAGTGFQAVWNKTQNNAQTTGNGGRTTDGCNDVRRGEALRTGDRQRDNLTGTQEKSDVKAEDGDAKDLEKVQEVLGTIVQNLIGQITDTFSVSEEELQGVMDELGMTETDLMDPVQLNELLMAVSGAEDSFALLTDEELYGNVKSILDLQKDLTGQAQEELQLTPEKWQDAVTKVVTEEPVITVEVEDHATDAAERSQSDVELPTVEQEPEEKIQAPVQNTQEEKTKDSGNRHESQTTGQQGNLLLQNLKEENFLSGLQQASQTEGTQTTDTQDIMRQIMDYMKVSVKADSSDLEMQLHPQSLGTLHVQVASKNGVVTANFITQNETVKAALESQMVQLKESFAEQGVKVEAIEVTVQTHSFEQNLEQGRGNQSDQESGAGVSRRRTRRINLNTAFAEDEPQTEEDRIAADIMSANGNTVDFTA